MKAVGVDIGGTKIAVALINETGDILDQVVEPTQKESSDVLLNQVVKMINHLLEKNKVELSDIEGIGCGVPGKVDHINGIAIFQNNVPLNNYPLVEKLAVHFPNTLIKIDNDVKCAALAEYRALEVTDKEVFTYITISTGIASTSFVNGKIIRGAGFSGEIGFLPVNDDGNQLESVAAGPGIEKLGQDLLVNPSLTTKDIFALAGEGNSEAIDAIKASVDAMAKGIFAHVCILDPHLIVLGGSVANHNPGYVRAIINALGTLLNQEQDHILDQIYMSNFKGDNGLIGAGMLVMGD